MRRTITTKPPRDELVTTEGAAEFLSLKPQTLAVWRSTRRYALPWVTVGRRSVRYRLSDLKKFIEAGVVNGDSA